MAWRDTKGLVEHVLDKHHNSAVAEALLKLVPCCQVMDCVHQWA
jgi:hypothetical protein